MKQEEWDSLSEGDVIRHKGASEGYTVMGNYMALGVLLSRSTLAHNPEEWDLIATANYQMADTSEATRDIYPSFEDFMVKDHGLRERMIVQALAMLSTTENYSDLTPEMIYETLVYNTKAVQRQVS